jgi:hypothetical protein
MDRSFIDLAAFPKEGSYIYFENLNYVQSLLLDKKNLSFKTF